MVAGLEPPAAAPTLTAKDFGSDQEVRWCPGCGDYAILKAVQKTLADLSADPDQTVFVSGIGCAGRLPYYMSTYGFHGIHGRAAPIATGLKLARPELDVWVISGDGDSLSIGGNHLLHLLRRNLDCQYLLFNNEIYGLTKGQYSPTSRPGTRSPSSPAGSIDGPVHACVFALGAGGRFVARAADVAQPALIEVLKRARAFPGTGFVEILQNCIVYNDDVFAEVTAKPTAAEHQLHLVHGQPLVFGKTRELGLRLDPRSLRLDVVRLGDGVSEADLLVHDETNPVLAQMLARMEPPDFPVAMGVLYADPAPTYERQFNAARPASLPADLGDLQALLARDQTWRAPAPSSDEHALSDWD
jgi:2-oxoglutarate ferredoxin oxidoreductase subunit beta